MLKHLTIKVKISIQILKILKYNLQTFNIRYKKNLVK